jgi:RNA polymerase sigma factor (TIGR02999 family)
VAGTPQHEVTGLLQAWSAGDKQALKQLLPLVYEELHRIAARQMAQQPAGHPLQTTALIHEAYLHLVGWKKVQWENRARFFAASAQLMRNILVDIARAQRQLKRGGQFNNTTLDEERIFQPTRPRDLLMLDEALTRLEQLDPRKSRIVELRFFGGLTAEETAALLNISDRTVLREWNVAKAWLYHEIIGKTSTRP